MASNDDEPQNDDPKVSKVKTRKNRRKKPALKCIYSGKSTKI